MSAETTGTVPEAFETLGAADPSLLGAELDRDPGLLQARDEEGCTLLLRAMELDRPDLAALLLERGADPRLADPHGVTALHLASTPEAAEALLDAGADVNARDRYGLSPLHNASLEGYADVADLLCRRGADIHAVEDKGFTPLQMARDYGLPEVAAVLERHGAEF